VQATTKHRQHAASGVTPRTSSTRLVRVTAADQKAGTTNLPSGPARRISSRTLEPIRLYSRGSRTVLLDSNPRNAERGSTARVRPACCGRVGYAGHVRGVICCAWASRAWQNSAVVHPAANRAAARYKHDSIGCIPCVRHPGDRRSKRNDTALNEACSPTLEQSVRTEHMCAIFAVIGARCRFGTACSSAVAHADTRAAFVRERTDDSRGGAEDGDTSIISSRPS